MLSALQPQFVAIGHVSFDVNTQPDGRIDPPEPGGAVMFGSVTALGMSYTAGIITSANDDYPFGRVGHGVSVRNHRADMTTTFEAAHQGRRRWHRLAASADPLTRDDVPLDWSRPEILLIAPLAGELPATCPAWFEPQVSCAIAQGWMRRWNDTGEETIDPIPPDGLTGLDVVVTSDDEISDEAIPAWCSKCRILAVTHGEQGVSLYEAGRQLDVRGFPVEAVDPTGAGDVWAAAFAIRLLETGDTRHSALFANAAASISVESIGLAGIPTRGEIELRLAEA